MRKHLLLFLAIIVLGAGAYFSERSFLSSQGDSLALQGVSLGALNAASEKSTGIEFTLIVGEELYEDNVPPGSTILDAMNILASSTKFRFTSKDFPGMGAFVESINGLPAPRSARQAGKIAADGYYWILYVNGAKAQQGISTIIVNPENSVEWKYEKGY
ncbi:MAG: DUF4430 domain-containing protein [bacterium]|nr:DUF4430 domain-containing protein [bacterium]